MPHVALRHGGVGRRRRTTGARTTSTGCSCCSASLPRLVQAHGPQARVARRHQRRSAPRAHDVGRRPRGGVPSERHRRRARGRSSTCRAPAAPWSRRATARSPSSGSSPGRGYVARGGAPRGGAGGSAAGALRERLRDQRETRLPPAPEQPFAFHRNLADHLHLGEPLGRHRGARCGGSSPCSRRRSARAAEAARPSRSPTSRADGCDDVRRRGRAAAPRLGRDRRDVVASPRRRCCPRSPRARGPADCARGESAHSIALRIATALLACTGATPGSSTIPTSRRSTCRLPNACIARMGGARRRCAASTCCARSRWPPPPRMREAMATACAAARVALIEAYMTPFHPRAPTPSRRWSAPARLGALRLRASRLHRRAPIGATTIAGGRRWAAARLLDVGIYCLAPLSRRRPAAARAGGRRSAVLSRVRRGRVDISSWLDWGDGFAAGDRVLVRGARSARRWRSSGTEAAAPRRTARSRRGPLDAALHAAPPRRPLSRRWPSAAPIRTAPMVEHFQAVVRGHADLRRSGRDAVARLGGARALRDAAGLRPREPRGDVLIH